MPQTERRTACLTCGLRCDPDKWQCLRCNDRLWQELLTDLAEDAYYQADRERKQESGQPPASNAGGSSL